MTVWYKYFALFLFLSLTKLSTGQTLDCNNAASPFYLADIADSAHAVTARYATVKDYMDSTVNLAMDIYRPGPKENNPYTANKPVIILLYGGGFKQSGNIRTGFFVEMASYFAKKGFVVSVPYYRTGWNNNGQSFCVGTTLNQFEDAMYRAQQDVRAAVRFLKGNSAQYKIDTTNVFVFGLSAGAVAALGTLYDDTAWMNDDRETRLGSIDYNGNEYSNSPRVNGVISMAGAITSQDISFYGNAPAMFLHGTCDNAVIFTEGRMVSCSQTTYFYGPGAIATRMSDDAICTESHVFCGYDHTFSTKGLLPNGLPLSTDYIKKAASEFLYKVMCGNCSSRTIIANDFIQTQPEIECSNLANYAFCNDMSAISEFKMAIEPNHIFFNDRTFVRFVSEKDRTVTLRIYNMLGRQVQVLQYPVLRGASSVSFVSAGMAPGQYLVYAYDGNELIHRQKMIVEDTGQKY